MMSIVGRQRGRHYSQPSQQLFGFSLAWKRIWKWISLTKTSFKPREMVSVVILKWKGLAGYLQIVLFLKPWFSYSSKCEKDVGQFATTLLLAWTTDWKIGLIWEHHTFGLDSVLPSNQQGPITCHVVVGWVYGQLKETADCWSNSCPTNVSHSLSDSLVEPLPLIGIAFILATKIAKKKFNGRTNLSELVAQCWP